MWRSRWKWCPSILWGWPLSLYKLKPWLNSEYRLMELTLATLGCRGRLEPRGERQGSPWVGRQPVAGLTQTDTTHTNGQFRLVGSLTSLFLDCRRKPEKTQASTGRTCKLHTKRPEPRFEPKTTNRCTTMPPLHWISLCLFLLKSLIFFSKRIKSLKLTVLPSPLALLASS